MHFRGPGADDFENVRSLNRAFLALLRNDECARECLRGLPAGLATRLATLAEGEAERLAGTPFLLPSFRERDDEFWQALLAVPRTRDLFLVPAPPSDGAGRLIAAGLSFLWQLAKQNAYAARLICGASLHWCEELTERTLLQILTRAAGRRDVLVLRCGDDLRLWAKLLAGGVSSEPTVRRAAQLSALHVMLTQASQPLRRRRAAARTARTPTLEITGHDP